MTERYVSRAGLKLAGAAQTLQLGFTGKVVLDVGSSTGGFTHYALRRGAKKVIAVEAGTDQLHASLQNDPRVELHEKTDIRSLRLRNNELGIKSKDKIHDSKFVILDSVPDLVLVDVSFISLREVLPAIAKLCGKRTQVAALLKPQFEAEEKQLHRGVIKNDRLRRQILTDFENWAKRHYLITGKTDSELAGAKGNRERFYLLKTLK